MTRSDAAFPGSVHASMRFREKSVKWTLPGGRVDPGETLEQTAIREAFEETGLTICIVRELGQLNVPDGNGGVYEIHAFLAERIDDMPVAGDDAASVGWLKPDELGGMTLTTDLLGYLTRYGVYP